MICDVDLNVLIGDKPLGFFTGREDENMSTVYIYGASIDENGKASGGKAGNQTGRELRKQAWYKHKKGWRVFRAKDPEVAAKIAQDAKWAVANRHIGYDQEQRLTLYNAAKPHGFNCKLVTTACECDCSALVRVCCAYAGIMLPNFRTPTEPAALLNSGAFEEMKSAKYTDSPDYLKTGDILCTKTQGHTVIVGNDGPKANVKPPEGLSRGDYGTAVRSMQEALLRWDSKCLPKYGADGDFGAETEKALKAFQTAAKLPVTGVYDEATRAKLTGTQPVQRREVEITGDSVNVRSGPGTSGTRILAVAHKGDRLPFQGETRQIDGRDWYLVEYEGVNAWVSSKFAKVV
jgi:peptidoglycan hydrolase-like protein with peptidoglycan-binding domain